MGPLITREHRDKVASYLDKGPEQGATRRPRRPRERARGDGFFLGVSLIDDVTPEMDCYRDEIFGPVLSSSACATYDEAVTLINDNPYGNGAAIFTRDGGAARQFQFEVDAGMVGVNVPIPVPVANYSFGGWKASLFGDSAHLRPRSRQLLHPRQGRHQPLARSGDLAGRPRLPADALAAPRRRPPVRIVIRPSSLDLSA